MTAGLAEPGVAAAQPRPCSVPEAGRGFLQPDALLPPNPVGLYIIPAFLSDSGLIEGRSCSSSLWQAALSKEVSSLAL